MSESVGAFAYCSCGELNLTIDEGRHGQTLFGTASEKAMRHEAKCRGSTKVLPMSFDDEGCEVMLSSSLTQKQKKAIRKRTIYHG